MSVWLAMAHKMKFSSLKNVIFTFFREFDEEIRKAFNVRRHVKQRTKEFHQPKTPEELYQADRKKDLEKFRRKWRQAKQ